MPRTIDEILAAKQRLQRNRSYARPGPYVTRLKPDQEAAFQQWVQENQVPFDPADQTPDYDMRGYFAAMQAGDEEAQQAGNMHFPDRWKTPFHESFSNESMYATRGAPRWVNGALVDKTGRVIFRDR